MAQPALKKEEDRSKFQPQKNSSLKATIRDQSGAGKKRLGEMLSKEGYITSTQLDEALRLLREMHKVLLSKGRGSDRMPGEFRTSQNWIGGTRPGNATHVPPPPDKLLECMGQLEKFINNVPEKTSTLIKAALAHVQFETIHPFLDGNGRVGRLLITIMLCSEAILKEPLLYLSLYFKTHRNTYYDLLQQIRVSGDWESWIEFFLIAIKETADKAISAASELINLAEEDLFFL